MLLWEGRQSSALWMNSEPDTFPALTGTHLYIWVERSKLE